MQWQDISTAPKDGSRLLLAVMVDGGKRVVVGGFDSHWTGQCWVYEKNGVPVGTTPTEWMPLPTPTEQEET
jgi:hypothetical protein